VENILERALGKARKAFNIDKQEGSRRLLYMKWIRWWNQIWTHSILE